MVIWKNIAPLRAIVLTIREWFPKFEDANFSPLKINTLKMMKLFESNNHFTCSTVIYINFNHSHSQSILFIVRAKCVHYCIEHTIQNIFPHKILLLYFMRNITFCVSKSNIQTSETNSREQSNVGENFLWISIWIYFRVNKIVQRKS